VRRGRIGHGVHVSLRRSVEFPRFRRHLIAGSSGVAGSIGVHSVNPAVSGAGRARRGRVAALVREAEPPAPRELGVSPQSLRNWVKHAGGGGGERRDGLSSDEREELRRSGRDVRRLEQERENFECRGLPCPASPSAVSAFRFIAAEKAHYAVSVLCEVLGSVARALSSARPGRRPGAPSRTPGCWIGRIRHAGQMALPTYLHVMSDMADDRSAPRMPFGGPERHSYPREQRDANEEAAASPDLALRLESRRGDSNPWPFITRSSGGSSRSH
jgi:hypothetical protein